MNSKSIIKLSAQLKSQMAALAKLRDKLDDTIDAAEMLKADCEEAYDDLQNARDALSRLV
jgi:hypothetical protein